MGQISAEISPNPGSLLSGNQQLDCLARLIHRMFQAAKSDGCMDDRWSLRSTQTAIQKTGSQLAKRFFTLGEARLKAAKLLAF